VGVTFLSDKNAQMIDNVGFQFGYATKIRVYGGKLGIGVQLGFLSMKKSDVELNPNQPEDLSIISESVLNFDMKFGVHYQAPTWYAGVSCADILGGIRISGEEGVLKVPQQLYITGGYIWNLKTPVPWSIEPSLLIRTNMATWSFNAMAVARYNGIVWFGLAYELDWALGVVVGAVPFYNHSNAYLKGLEIGAAYSFPLAKFGYSRGGSMGDFEIIFRYGFSFYRDKTLTGYGSSRHLYKNQY
jgi:type IX secretion system PorP/SprF family membrane protein